MTSYGQSCLFLPHSTLPDCYKVNPKHDTVSSLHISIHISKDTNSCKIYIIIATLKNNCISAVSLNRYLYSLYFLWTRSSTLELDQLRIWASEYPSRGTWYLVIFLLNWWSLPRSVNSSGATLMYSSYRRGKLSLYVISFQNNIPKSEQWNFFLLLLYGIQWRHAFKYICHVLLHCSYYSYCCLHLAHRSLNKLAPEFLQHDLFKCGKNEDENQLCGIWIDWRYQYELMVRCICIYTHIYIHIHR